MSRLSYAVFKSAREARRARAKIQTLDGDVTAKIVSLRSLSAESLPVRLRLMNVAVQVGATVAASLVLAAITLLVWGADVGGFPVTVTDILYIVVSCVVLGCLAGGLSFSGAVNRAVEKLRAQVARGRGVLLLETPRVPRWARRLGALEVGVIF